MLFASPAVDCTDRPVVPLAGIAGGLFSAAWFLYIDAILMHAITPGGMPLTSVHATPGLIAMLAAVMLVCAPLHVFSYGGWAPRRRWCGEECVRIWIFVAFVALFGSIIMAVVLTETSRAQSGSAIAFVPLANASIDHAAAEAAYVNVGYASIAQTVMLLASAGAWLGARLIKIEDQHLYPQSPPTNRHSLNAHGNAGRRRRHPAATGRCGTAGARGTS